MGLPKSRLAPYIVGVGSVALLWAIWELAGKAGSALTVVLPPPSQFLTAMAESDFKIGLGSQSATVVESATATFMRVFAGIMLAFIAAIGTGALLSLSRFATWSISPILQFLAPIAPIAWIPTAIVVFGINNAAAIFIVFMGVYFILTIGTLVEIRRLPPEFQILAGNLGASAWQQWRWVVFPAILPGIFTLIRANFIAAWMAVLVAEMVGLGDGLGAIIMTGRNLFNSDLVMFGMAIIALSGFIVDRLLAFVGDRILWWRV